MTEINPTITADQDRRAYQPYNFLVRQEGSTYYVINGLTDAVLTSSASAITAIQAANDALTAGRTWKEKILFMGDYSSVSVSYIIDSNTIFELIGRLKLANSANVPIVKNRSGISTEGSQDKNIELVGGEYDGNKANQASGFLINFFTCNNLTIRNIYSHDAKFDGLTLQGCDNVDIVGSRFHNNDAMGVRATSDTTYGVHSEDLRVVNCHATNNAINGFWIGGQDVTYECFNATFVGNTARDNLFAGIYVDWHAYGVTVSGNSCESNGISTGIGGGGGIVFNGQANGTPYYGNRYTNITGNSCYNNRESGIFATYAKNTMVVGNYCSFNQWRGMQLTSCKNCQFSDNVCVDNSQKTANTYEGIMFIDSTGSDLLNYPSIDNIIENNTCYDDQGTKTQKYGIAMIGIAYRNTIRNNHLRGNLTGGASITDISNCYDNDGFRVKRGRWSGQDPVLSADGSLQGMITTYATTGTMTRVIDSTGTKIRFTTSTVTNDITGARVAPFTEQDQNCVFKCKFKLTQADANCIMVLGFHNNTALNPSDSANPMVNFEGVTFMNITGTWWIRSNNGNASVTGVNTTIAYDTLVHELTIFADNSGPRWYVLLDNVLFANGLITIDLPAATTDLGLYWYIKTVTTAAKSFDMWDVEVLTLD